MKKYIGMLLALGLTLAGFVLPQDAWAYDGQSDFAWTLTAEAGAVADDDGDAVPAVRLYFEWNEAPDYVEVYRNSPENRDFYWIGTYLWQETDCFCDGAVSLNEIYDYCAVACWYATEEEPWHTSDVSNIVSCGVKLGKPQVETMSAAKYARLVFAGEDPEDELRYGAAGDGVYLTGFQIYRSRKEDSGYKLIASVPAGETGYKDSTAVKGKLYFYKVCAFYYDKANDLMYTGPFSDIRMCCPGSKNFPDMYDLDLTAEWKSDTSAKVGWNEVEGFVAETLCYAGRRTGEKTFGSPEYVDLSKKTVGCTLRDLEEGCEYEIRLLVRARIPYNDGNDNFYYDSRWYSYILEE